MPIAFTLLKDVQSFQITNCSSNKIHIESTTYIDNKYPKAIITYDENDKTTFAE